MRPALVTIALVLLLLSAGCVKGAPADKDDRANKKEKTVLENTANKNASSQSPEVVVKTDNQVSNQEAGAVLDEVDQQLSDLLNTLNRLDDVDDQDLNY